VALNRLDLAKADLAFRHGAQAGVRLAGEHILQVSNQHVPLLEGTLERSGKVSEPQVDGGDVVGAVSYDTLYAVAQHEDLTFHHSEGRTAKYLENAVNSTQGVALAIIAQAIRNELGGPAKL